MKPTRMRPLPAETEPEPFRLPSWVVTGVSVVLILTAGAIAYSNSLNGPFIFDDLDQIVGNAQIQTFWPPWAPLQKTNRPVGNVTFALDFLMSKAIFGDGLDVRTYHATNVAIHILAGLVLFDLVRRTLAGRRLGVYFAGVAGWLALTVALFWTLHPMETQAVTYIVQRLESLMGLFYLLTLYGFVRAQDSPRPRVWYAASVVFCALGMGTKEVMVTAPLMVLWYDRVFIAQTWEDIKARVAYYGSLAGTWGLMGILIFINRAGYFSGKTMNVKGVSPLDYLLTQAEVLVHYLKLSVWPNVLVLDYSWPVRHPVYGILPPVHMIPYVLAIVILLGLTILCIFRWPTLGFLGGWFFMVLSVSSSIVPIIDLAFEHRMYLSLAAVVTLLVVGGFAGARALLVRLGFTPDQRQLIGIPVMMLLVIGLSSVLGYRTWLRNQDYDSPLKIWHDTVLKRETNARAHNNRGALLASDGKIEEAVKDFDRAIELKDDYADPYNNRGASFAKMDRCWESIRDCTKAIELNPEYADAFHNRGLAYLGLAKTQPQYNDKVIEDATKAIELRANYPEAYLNRGNAHSNQQHYNMAIDDYTTAIKLRPTYADAYHNRSVANCFLKNFDAAWSDLHTCLQLGGHAERTYIDLLRQASGRQQ